MISTATTVIEAIHDNITLEVINASRSDHSLIRTKFMPTILFHEHQLVESTALNILLNAMEKYLRDNEPITGWLYPRPFEHVVPSFYIHPQYVHLSDGKGGEEKYFIGREAIKSQGTNFIVYALGINGEPQFENYMAGLGASVYGFDCTDFNRPEYKFHFYQWCVGKNTSVIDPKNRFNTRVGGPKIFMPLAEIKRQLGHKKIDMLKFDIEGFEWQLFEDDLLRTDPDDLPEQLLFELHTEGSKPRWVPPANVRLRRHHQVNELVYKLWLLGYRCINVEVNKLDAHCAELAFVRLPSKHSGKHLLMNSGD